jgi:hypothetical protein
MSYTARKSGYGRRSIDSFADSWIDRVARADTFSAWPSANLAIYVPVAIPTRCVVFALWFAGGSTGTGNVDMGLFDATGAAVISVGAVAKAASSNEQRIDVTDTVVGPGLYYIGISSNSGTDTFYRQSSPAPIQTARGLLTEAAAYPLPSTATWAVLQTLDFQPVVGLLLNAGDVA